MLVYESKRPQGARALLLTVKAGLTEGLAALNPVLAAWLVVHLPPFRAPLITDDGIDGTQVVALPREALLDAIAEARRVRTRAPESAEAAHFDPLIHEKQDLPWMERSLLRTKGLPCASIASPPKARKRSAAPWTPPVAAAIRS